MLALSDDYKTVVVCNIQLSSLVVLSINITILFDQNNIIV